MQSLVTLVSLPCSLLECVVFVFVFLSVFVFVSYQAGSLVYHCLDASFVCICARTDGKLVEINGSPAIRTK